MVCYISTYNCLVNLHNEIVSAEEVSNFYRNRIYGFVPILVSLHDMDTAFVNLNELIAKVKHYQSLRTTANSSHLETLS